MNQDAEHLRLLSIFHYIVGGLTVLIACIPLIHVTIGLLFVLKPHAFAGSSGPPPPAWFGWFFIVLGGTFFFLGQALAGCMIAGGRCLAKRRKYLFVLVIACLECMFVPFGTVLGVFTILVLMRPSVKLVFGAAGVPPPMPPAPR